MCRVPAEWHWLTPLFLGSLDVFEPGPDKLCRACCSPAAISSLWAVVFCLYFLSFSPWSLEVYKKSFGILYISVSQTLGWIMELSPGQAALHHFSCFFCYPCLPPQHVDRPEGGLKRTFWKSAVTDGMHECLSVSQAKDCLFREQLWGKDPGLQVGRGRGIFQSGETGGTWTCKAWRRHSIMEYDSSPPRLWTCHEVDPARQITVLQGRRMWNNRHKLKEESFTVDIRKLFFPQGDTGCSEMLHNLCSWRFTNASGQRLEQANLLSDVRLLWVKGWTWDLSNLKFPVIICLPIVILFWAVDSCN